jgi:hypothetical protein
MCAFKSRWHLRVVVDTIRRVTRALEIRSRAPSFAGSLVTIWFRLLVKTHQAHQRVEVSHHHVVQYNHSSGTALCWMSSTISEEWTVGESRVLLMVVDRREGKPCSVAVRGTSVRVQSAERRHGVAWRGVVWSQGGGTRLLVAPYDWRVFYGALCRFSGRRRLIFAVCSRNSQVFWANDPSLGRRHSLVVIAHSENNSRSFDIRSKRIICGPLFYKHMCVWFESACVDYNDKGFEHFCHVSVYCVFITMIHIRDE